MNATVAVYWDHLENTYGPLACAPHGGDPDYAFACSYTLTFLPIVHLLTASWLFMTTYRDTQLFRQSKASGIASSSRVSRYRSNSSRVVQNSNQNANGANPTGSFGSLQAQKLSWFGQQLTHGGHLGLVVGLVSLLRAIGFLLSGCGTSHSADELRGQLGDGFCESCVANFNHKVQEIQCPCCVYLFNICKQAYAKRTN
jgi:hypothetical protein